MTVEQLLERALESLRDGEDPIGDVELALGLLLAEQDAVEFIAEQNTQPVCTCPPDLLARGGWRSSCPVHRSAAEASL